MDPTSIRYLALGDSFTIGTGTTPDKAFPALLAARWRTAGRAVELLNPAVNGYTTDDLITRELPHVMVFKPTFVTLLIGANDIVRGGSDDKRYRGQLRRIYSQLRDDGVPGSAIVGLPQPEWSRSPAASPYGTTEALLTRIAHFNAIAMDEAENAGARFIDLYPLMHRQAAAEMLATDGLHPNAEAHEEWARTLSEKLILTPVP
ncbi:MAG TPA: SGNH/GDSL hydrolase family protein [Candidatus Saccharimonadales bacterium]|jgi:acyl-CoA thioesterase-1|nr:SGNH/GDSL hydrolase family protein [Candidatus Saccharimonadales bacterium]